MPPHPALNPTFKKRLLLFCPKPAQSVALSTLVHDNYNLPDIQAKSPESSMIHLIISSYHRSSSGDFTFKIYPDSIFFWLLLVQTSINFCLYYCSDLLIGLLVHCLSTKRQIAFFKQLIWIILFLKNSPMALNLTKPRSQSFAVTLRALCVAASYFLSDLTSCCSLPHCAAWCSASLIFLKHARYLCRCLFL